MPIDAYVPETPFHAGDATDRDVWLRGDHHARVQIVVVSGDIDASNIEQISDYAYRVIAGGRGLVLDLSAVDFLGVAGFHQLVRIGEQCARTRSPWALVGSDAVQRMLRLVDPTRRLPTEDCLTCALQRLGHALQIGRYSWNAESNPPHPLLSRAGRVDLRPVTLAHHTRC